jgi:hypothetical protein
MNRSGNDVGKENSLAHDELCDALRALQHAKQLVRVRTLNVEAAKLRMRAAHELAVLNGVECQCQKCRDLVMRRLRDSHTLPAYKSEQRPADRPGHPDED